MDERLVEFSALLRQNGVRVSVAESMDAFRALAVTGLMERAEVRAALRTTMVKRSVDVPVFEELFDLFFSGLGQTITNITKGTAQALEMSEEDLRRLHAASQPGPAAQGPLRPSPRACPSTALPRARGFPNPVAAWLGGGRARRERPAPPGIRQRAPDTMPAVSEV